jgi:hypothetical protein
MNPSRTAIASLIFLLCCLLSSVRIVVDAPTPRQLCAFHSEIARQSDERFAELRTMLPESGVVGYVGESGPAADGSYYLAQYALAPLVVDRSANHALVVGNFATSQVSQSPAENLRLLKDFGNGVLLFAAKGAAKDQR